MNIVLVVPGTPEPKGSYHMQRRGAKSWIVAGSNANMKKRMDEWSFRVRTYAERSARANGLGAPYDGPIAADVTFYMPRPKSAANRTHCAVRPDLDKLLRGVFDPLMGIVFTEDSRIVSLAGQKVYADDSRERPAGAIIRVWSV